MGVGEIVQDLLAAGLGEALAAPSRTRRSVLCQFQTLNASIRSWRVTSLERMHRRGTATHVAVARRGRRRLLVHPGGHQGPRHGEAPPAEGTEKWGGAEGDARRILNLTDGSGKPLGQ